MRPSSMFDRRVAMAIVLSLCALLGCALDYFKRGPMEPSEYGCVAMGTALAWFVWERLAIASNRWIRRDLHRAKMKHAAIRHINLT